MEWGRARPYPYLYIIKLNNMKSKYLPELVLMWLVAVMVVCLATSCTSPKAIKSSTIYPSGSSKWKYVELKGNRTTH